MLHFTYLVFKRSRHGGLNSMKILYTIPLVLLIALEKKSICSIKYMGVAPSVPVPRGYCGSTLSELGAYKVIFLQSF